MSYLILSLTICRWFSVNIQAPLKFWKLTLTEFIEDKMTGLTISEHFGISNEVLVKLILRGSRGAEGLGAGLDSGRRQSKYHMAYS
jgi:hypothetical protein